LTATTKRQQCKDYTVTLLRISPLPPKVTTTTLSRLTPVSSPLCLNLLVPTHARTKSDVYAWWGVEAEALGDLGQVKLVNVKDGA
jgi:hypothetical protein